jgi:C1A family cysteine protease
MFLYKTARHLLHWAGDMGASLRASLKAMVRFGVPPEEYFPYDPATYDAEPAPFLFSFHKELRTIRYERLDPPRTTGTEILRTVKSYLAAGFPTALGFPVCGALSEDADIPLPTKFVSVRGGQAVVAVGYDDGRRIRSTKGALVVRNSWGSEWGEGGYGWLPYAYIEEGLAKDFWTLLSPEWFNSGEFSRPS